MVLLEGSYLGILIGMGFAILIIWGGISVGCFYLGLRTKKQNAVLESICLAAGLGLFVISFYPKMLATSILTWLWPLFGYMVGYGFPFQLKKGWGIWVALVVLVLMAWGFVEVYQMVRNFYSY